jgi:hypothetical protein
MWMRAPVFVTFRTTQSMTEDVPRVTFAPLRMCARSATPFSAATVLHDSSQDVGNHIDAGANGKKESSSDKKIFGPYHTQVGLQRFTEFLHWTHLANSHTSWQFSTKVI